MKYLYSCPHELHQKAQTLDDALMFMRAAIAQLQRHIDHLHIALEANGIQVHEDLLVEQALAPDNLPIPPEEPKEPS